MADIDTDDTAGEQPQLTVQQICLEVPLYARVDCTTDTIHNLRYLSVHFDAYCIWCCKESHFRYISPHRNPPGAEIAAMPGMFKLNVTCSRERDHIYSFEFRLLSDLKLIKFGQYPSLADISGDEIRKYKSVLRNGYFEELTRANGLISHGIGIGAFVYLRRIFEKLIHDHRLELESIDGPIEGFDGMSMGEKIDALRSVLPSALVRNRATYSILSAGIHSLSEDDCKLFYPALKAAILQILEQDLQARERAKAERETEEHVAKIQRELKTRLSMGTSE